MVIRQIYLTLLWHQNLMDPGPLAAPEVLDLGTYQGLFNTSRKNQAGPLTVPWPPYERQQYWERYLGRSLPAVTAREARRALVPLRTPAPLALASQEDTKVGTEGFLHPWGASFLVALQVEGEWPDLAAAAERVVALRRDPHFSLPGQKRQIRLEEAAAHGLDAMRALAHKAAAGPKSDAFSVCVLVSAEGDMASFDPAVEQNGASRFLQAVTSFSPTWRLDALRPLTETRVAGIADAPPSHLVYGVRRGRAIWSPAHFLLEPEEAGSTLTCQYRNLVLASMQTEALGRFADDTASRLDQDIALSDEHRALAGWAVRILERVHAGSTDTYKSGALKAQLEQNQLLGPINAVRQDQGLPAIP